jgi:hypothetical protein
MGQGRLYRSICLGVLLIATAIQGATPDAQDLASIKPLWLLCRLLARPDTLSDDDGLPDDVCGPMSTEMDLIARQHAESGEPGIFECLATERLLNACQSGAPRSTPAVGNAPQSGGLIYTLCRLVC